MLVAGKGHGVAHTGPHGALRGLAGLGGALGPAAGRGPGVVYIGQLAVLGPPAGVVARLGADVAHGGDLHLVLPLGAALHRQAVPNVDADMPGHPDGLTDDHIIPAGSAHPGAFGNHGISADVRHPVDGVARPAVGPGGVPVPAPEDALDEAHTVKAENRRALVGRRLNHGGAGGVLVVGVVVAVAAHIGAGEGGPKAPHHIQGLVVLGDVHGLVHKGLGGHFTHCKRSFTQSFSTISATRTATSAPYLSANCLRNRWAYLARFSFLAFQK